MSNSLSNEVSSRNEKSESKSEVVGSESIERLRSSQEKFSIFGGKVKFDMCSPLSISYLALNRISMYLLTNFAMGPGRELYEGMSADNLLSKHFVLLAKVSHSKRKWFSSSIHPFEQYLHLRSNNGIGLGFPHLPISIPK